MAAEEQWERMFISCAQQTQQTVIGRGLKQFDYLLIIVLYIFVLFDVNVCSDRAAHLNLEPILKSVWQMGWAWSADVVH